MWIRVEAVSRKEGEEGRLRGKKDKNQEAIQVSQVRAEFKLGQWQEKDNGFKTHKDRGLNIDNWLDKERED